MMSREELQKLTHEQREDEFKRDIRNITAPQDTQRYFDELRRVMKHYDPFFLDRQARMA
jgi:hypothetical protein